MSTQTSTRHATPSGFLLVLVMVFGAIFFLMATAFIGYVVTQGNIVRTKHAKEASLNIAEAGLNYYRWFLSHYPGDTTNGTSTPGPYVHVYNDPEGGAMGEFSLTLASSTVCGEVYAVDITSTGKSYENPNVTRSVYGRYARPTVAEYAYIINANVWAGADRTIIGPYHSNGVIRMDGTNNSTVSSGQESWVCDGSLPCSPGGNGSVKNGVYGDGPNSQFWNFPTPPINFTGLTVDLSAMQTKAQSGGGLYFGPSGGYGYRIVFNSNGTITVYRVTNTSNYWGYSDEDDWLRERNVITGTSLVGTYTVPTGCSIIYVEDKVWLEGTVKGKVTIAAADVDTPGNDPSIILNNNILYANATSGLLAIGEENVLVGLQVPDDMTLNGIFVAQKGRFGRNHYCQNNCSSHSGDEGLPGSLDSYVYRDTLTINGTIVSNQRVGTKWTSGGGSFISGFNTRFNSYDRNLVASPPPLTPDVSDTFRFIEWQEVD